MAKEIKLTDGTTAIFNDSDSLEKIDRVLAAEGLERVKGGALEKIAEPVIEAASGIVGLPGSVQELMTTGGAFAGDLLYRALGMEVPPGFREAARPEIPLPTAGDVRSTIERLGIQGEKAESPLGRFAQSSARNILMAPVRPAIIPSVISAGGEEAVAFPFRGTELEPYARVAGGVAAPLGYGVVAGRSSPQTIAREELQGVSQQDLAAARRLQAESAAAGAPVTATEAIQRAAGEARGIDIGGPTRLPELQRMIESSRGGGPIMRQFMAGREALGEQAILAAAPSVARPTLGMEVQEAAQMAQRQAQREVSQQVEPLFGKIRSLEIPKEDFDAVVKDNAIVKSVFSAVKSKPEWREASKDMKENSVGFVEIMRQELGDRLADASMKGQANKARVLQQAYDDLKLVADDAVGGDYQAALTATRQARREIQSPLESSPLARVSETSLTPQQFASIFAKNAKELNVTPEKVKQTVSSFSKQDPLLAQEFVSQYLKSEFDKIPVSARRELRRGARFSDTVLANETQRQNLLAAYESAYGKDAKEGLNRLLRGLKTQAERLPAGSPTQEKGAMAERGVSQVKEVVSRPFTALGNLADSLISGRDMERFALAITSNQGVDELAKLASSPLSPAQVGATAVAIQRILLEME